MIFHWFFAISVSHDDCPLFYANRTLDQRSGKPRRVRRQHYMRLKPLFAPFGDAGSDRFYKSASPGVSPGVYDGRGGDPDPLVSVSQLLSHRHR